ncbi:PA-phosphatase related-family protein [Colletotrichum spaethianum]|uniref:PA-phosphatase related-family protein n=1 Tax=Colletotrichum spaethianum TaxID=700344 RepID=A0AA37PAL9_9PEZI|nr:PA-phosphatase related-family protein [Colletotrichum spaethianum]GKT48718.1 PA-phosphatase related-family protein [Colletotrichum spaethianum]
MRQRSRMQQIHGDDHNPVPEFTRDTIRSVRASWEFFLAWLRLTWFDILVMSALGGAALGIYNAPLAAVRNFPITFNGSGDIVYPQFAYPDRGWIIDTWLSALLSAIIPIVVIILAQFRVRSIWDMNNGIIGLIFSISLGTLIQVVIKQLIGGFRPYFLAVCMPDISRAATNNVTGLNAVGFQQVMYSVDVCTQPDPIKLKNAMTSFPSGHSTAAFAAYVYLFLYLNAKLKVWADYRPALWKIAFTFAPLLGALLIACSLTIDQAHNWYDIVAGSAIGIAVAFGSYRGCYAAIWDWRFNHIPLQRRDQLDYFPEDGTEYRDLVFTRSGGWGQTSEETSEKRTPSGRSSSSYATQQTAYHGVAERESLPHQPTRTRYKQHRNSQREDRAV